MQPRACPLCDADEAETLAELEAAEFCRTNWTYDPRFRELLALPEPATFPLRRCTFCGFVYAGLLPDAAFLTKLYDEVIRGAECIEGSEHRASYARRLRYAAELIELAPAGPALDYGSGLGVTVRILRACGVEAVGYEPSATRRDYSGDEPATPEALAQRGPFAMFVLDNVLEHLPEPVETVERLAAMALPRAVAYVSVPPYEPAFLQRQLEAHRAGTPLDMTLNPWEHLNYFSLVHLDSLMEHGGFRRIPASERASTPNVGLRAERSPGARARNAAASALRLARYAAKGDVLATAEHAFYRRG